jgi:hypothetical protein
MLRSLALSGVPIKVNFRLQASGGRMRIFSSAETISSLRDDLKMLLSNFTQNLGENLHF